MSLYTYLALLTLAVLALHLRHAFLLHTLRQQMFSREAGMVLGGLLHRLHGELVALEALLTEDDIPLGEECWQTGIPEDTPGDTPKETPRGKLLTFPPHHGAKEGSVSPKN